MDEGSAAVGIAWVNEGAVLEKAGDTLTVLAVQWSGGGTEEFEKRRQAVGGGAGHVGGGEDGRFEQGQIPLLDSLEELLIGLGGPRGWRCGLGAMSGPSGCQSKQCHNGSGPVLQP